MDRLEHIRRVVESSMSLPGAMPYVTQELARTAQTIALLDIAQSLRELSDDSANGRK